MTISKVMQYLDETKIEELGKLYQVDKVNTKITGNFVLQSFVRNALMGISNSLRSLEAISKTTQMSKYLKAKNENNKKAKHSSIGGRLEKISIEFFKAIYENLVERYNADFGGKKAENNYCIFDSTIITASGKLLKDGLKLGGKQGDKHIKMSVELYNSIPKNIRFCDTQEDSSEDVALVKAINASGIIKENVIIFDRGISSVKTFDDFSERKIMFITRVSANRRYKVIESCEINHSVKHKDSNIKIISDEIVNLYLGNKIFKRNLKLIKAIKTTKKNDKITEEELYFLTNNTTLSAYEIAAIYKRRWNIEVLFKFLKQNLQFKQFVSYNMNGMQVYIYCLLIAAILFTIFKKINNKTGFKIALLEFRLLLEREITKNIVIMCGGDPNLITKAQS